MTAALTWLFVTAGVVATFRAARHIVGTGAAILAAGALLLGQLLTFPLQVGDAAIFALAALAVERGLALTAANKRGALALLLLPALGPFATGAGWPSAAKIVDVLFCSQHGVVSTSAVIWLGFAGALLDRRLAVGLVAVLIAASASLDTSMSWQEAMSLSAAAIPFAGAGLALLTARVRDAAARRPAWTMAALLTPLLLFNVTLAVVAYRGGVRLGEPVAFADAGAAQIRLTHDWLGHPLAFPASAFFRATSGLPASRFDLQGISHLDAAHPIVVDIGSPGDAAWIGDGWHGAERDGETTFRWANRVTEIYVPALPPGRVVVRLHVRPATAPAMPTQTLSLQVGPVAVSAVPLATDAWTWVECELDLGSRGQRASRLTLTFDHVVRPSAISASGDQRDLAAAFDRIEIVVR